MKQQTDVTLGEHSYVVGKMNAMDQFHVARRLAPMMANMGITAAQLKSLGAGTPQVDELMALLAPAVGTLSAMDNENVEYIINTCLRVVWRLEGDKRQPLTVDNRMMYQDVDMVGMLYLTFEVCKFNLQGFMPGLSGLINSLGPSTQAQNSPST